jgi:hypothetical protein
MIKKINYLKSLAFPYDEISEMKYGSGDTTQSSQYAYSPNLVYLSIGDMYKNVFGFIENLSFSIEDNITWPSNFDDPTDTFMYPSVVDVSIGMKIIENHKTETTNGITTYKYDFDGRGSTNSISETTEVIKTEPQQSQAQLNALEARRLRNPQGEVFASSTNNTTDNSIPQMRGVSQMRQLGT